MNQQTLELLVAKIRIGGSSLPSAIRFRNSKTISQLISKDFPVAEICSNHFSELFIWHIDHINKNRYQNFIGKYKKIFLPRTNFYNFVKKNVYHTSKIGLFNINVERHL